MFFIGLQEPCGPFLLFFSKTMPNCYLWTFHLHSTPHSPTCCWCRSSQSASGLDLITVGWILDFLTNRTHRVRVNNHVSALVNNINWLSPRLRSLSPLLCITCTNDCCSEFDNHHIVEYADDTVIVSLLNDVEISHGPVLNYFLNWCTALFHTNHTCFSSLIGAFKLFYLMTLHFIYILAFFYHW